MNDVIIIGAGAAGLIAANHLVENRLKVCVLEARDRIGGRIYTLPENEWGYAAEAGAEFIHGRLPITLNLMKEAGIRKNAVEGEMWQVIEGRWQKEDSYFEDEELVVKKLKSLEYDLSMAEFLDKEFDGDAYIEIRRSLTGYIEGYYAADLDRTSAKTFLTEWQSEDEQQFRPNNGYASLLHFLKTKIVEAGGEIILSSIVKFVIWKQGLAEITDEKLNVFTSKKVLITVPTGVWTAGENEMGAIKYRPGLPQKTEAANQLGFGSVIKILILFTNEFSKQLKLKKKDIGFIFSDEAIGTWWTQHAQKTNLLTGWLAGPKAYELKNSSNEIILDRAIESLANLFLISRKEIENSILKSKIINWTAEPFARGAYSYSTLQTGAARYILARPVENTLFFAGEALYNGTETGTVEAAFTSGLQAADEILKTIKTG